MIAFVRRLPAMLWDRYLALSITNQRLVCAYLAIHVVGLVAVIILSPSYIFGVFSQWAKSLRMNDYGYLYLLAVIILTAFPPMVGYGTCISLCGFAFGAQKGWLIAATGCVTGALLSFMFTRRLLHMFTPMLSRHAVFKALALAVREKGTPLVILIRLCPFPFPYSNAFFASIETVSLAQFFLATLIITPKLFLHVWVGSRLYAFADPESRSKMDTNTKIINGVFIGLSSILGAAVSYYLYHLTMKYVREVTDSAGLDLEHGGLLDDVDAMLEEHDLDPRDEEEEEDAGGLGPATASLLNPSTRPSATRTASAPDTIRLSTTVPLLGNRRSTDTTKLRPLEDAWEGTFSDFEEEQDVHSELEGPDDAHHVVEVASVDSPVDIGIDKRKD